MTPVVAFHDVSKWYGNVIGVNKLTLAVRAGVTGLLGPERGGEVDAVAAGHGAVAIRARARSACWASVCGTIATLNRRIGLCPEQDAFYEWMTGRDFVHTCARLSGLARGEARSRGRAGDGSGRHDEAPGPRDSRLLEGHAAADQAGPSPGARARRAVSRRAAHRHRPGRPPRPDGHHRRLGSEGKSVLVSSHVLHEVESLTPNIVLLSRGRLVAEGQRPADSRSDRQASAPDRAARRRLSPAGCAAAWRSTTWKGFGCSRANRA